jgi:hypothetical protein
VSSSGSPGAAWHEATSFPFNCACIVDMNPIAPCLPWRNYCVEWRPSGYVLLYSLLESNAGAPEQTSRFRR